MNDIKDPRKEEFGKFDLTGTKVELPQAGWSKRVMNQIVYGNKEGRIKASSLWNPQSFNGPHDIGSWQDKKYPNTFTSAKEQATSPSEDYKN